MYRSISEICFQDILDMGRFPSQWKLANLIPIYIGKESHIIKNYRPSCLVKTFEGIVTQQTSFPNHYHYFLISH